MRTTTTGPGGDAERVPVAASERVRALVSGPERPGRVLGVFRTVVYVQVEGAVEGAPDVLALETSDALRLPTALVIASGRAGYPFADVRSGDAATVGREAVTAGPVRTRVVRWWRPRRARNPVATGSDPAGGAPAESVDRARARLPAVSPDVRDAWSALQQALGRDLVPPAVLRSLVGRGGGLTPEGDDLLAGLLVAGAALGPHAPRHLRDLPAAVSPLLGRTTALSASLLAEAADGYAVPPVLDLVAAVGARAEVETAVVRLVSVGHTSGAALAHGVLAGLRVPVPPTGSEIAS